MTTPVSINIYVLFALLDLKSEPFCRPTVQMWPAMFEHYTFSNGYLPTDCRMLINFAASLMKCVVNAELRWYDELTICVNCAIIIQSEYQSSPHLYFFYYLF